MNFLIFLFVYFTHILLNIRWIKCLMMLHFCHQPFGIQFDCTFHLVHLRLLQTFAGVLQKKFKNRFTRSAFNETLTNYISVERL